MIPTPPIMLKTPYSRLSLLFEPLIEPKIIYNIFYLLRKPKGRTVGDLVYALSSGRVHELLGGVLKCLLR